MLSASCCCLLTDHLSFSSFHPFCHALSNAFSAAMQMEKFCCISCIDVVLLSLEAILCRGFLNVCSNIVRVKNFSHILYIGAFFDDSDEYVAGEELMCHM